MTLPILTVSIGRSGWILGSATKSILGTTTYLGYATFDDITSKVRQISIRRGRQHELDRVEAGTATVVLMNQDGVFDPMNTSSPYYPDIRPMVPLRIRATFTPAFSPTDIASLRGWYDFSDGTTLFTDTGRTTPVSADGQTIKGMTDKSGQGNHLTEATNGPTYKVNIQNGLSAGRFDGVNDTLANTSSTIPSAAQPLTIFTVQDENSGIALNKGGVWVFGASGTPTTGRFTTVGILDYDVASTWTGAFDLVTFVLDASVDGTFWRGGGTALGTVAGSTFSGAGTATFTMGGATLNGDIAEMLIFTGDLHAADLTAFNNVGAFLATKWNKTWTTVT